MSLLFLKSKLYLPVSYTHLDVYKRQPDWRGKLPIFFGTWNGKQELPLLKMPKRFALNDLFDC